jgi:hypothetical protein
MVGGVEVCFRGGKSDVFRSHQFHIFLHLCQNSCQQQFADVQTVKKKGEVAAERYKNK